MAQGKAQGVVFQFTAPALLAHPNFFTPRKFRDAAGRESGEPKYDGRFVFDLDWPDLPTLGEKLVEAARNAWPGAKFANPLNFPRPAPGSIADPLFMPVEWCLKSGTEIADKARRENKDREAFRGKLVLVSRGQYAPGLSAVLNGRIKDFPMDGPERVASEPYFYGGVEVLAQLQFVGYQVGNNAPVVTAYPNVIMSLNRGDRIASFSGGTAKSGAAVFGAHVGQYTAVDPMAGSPGSTEGIAGLV